MYPQIDRHYQAPSTSLWQGRKENMEAQKIYQIIQCLDLSIENLSRFAKGLAIIGFMSDEGIKRNQGRIGAYNGSDEIRKQLAKLPIFNQECIYDLGNIKCINDDLEGAQIALGKLINYCHEQGFKTLVLGGGHETAWGHYLGLKNSYPDLGLINCDAHFDLRDDELASSGTPFLQIAKDKEKLNQPFDYLCFGIQKTANAPALYHQAERLNVQYITAKEIYSTAVNWQQTYIEDFINQKQSIYLSICMDVFNGCVAPGVSAPQALGIMPWHLMPILNFILKSDKVISVDVVELSPPNDRDEMTSRLASQIAAEVVYSL